MSAEVTFSTSVAAATLRTLQGLQDELQDAEEDLREALQDEGATQETPAFVRIAERMTRVRGALLMVRKPATAWLASEVQALFAAAGAGALVDRPAVNETERARVLIESIDALETAVAALDAGAGSDSALPWLDRINDMRSLRGKSFVSDALLLALDIDVDSVDAESQALSEASLKSWHARCEQRRPQLVRALVDWFRTVNSGDEDARIEAVGAVAGQLEALDNKGVDVPPFEAIVLQAAQTVATAVVTQVLEDSGSLRRLFGLIERRLINQSTAQSAEVSSDARVDGDKELLRNILYYAALAGRDPETRNESLESRFDLKRVRDAVLQVPAWRHAAPSVSKRLLDSLYQRALAHLQPIEAWLESGAHWTDKRSANTRRSRLRELSAVLTLFGEEETRDALTRLDASLTTIQSGQTPDAETRLDMARQLLELRQRMTDESQQAMQVRPDPVAAESAEQVSPTPAADSRVLAQRIAQTGRPVSSDRELRRHVEHAQISLIQESRSLLRETEPEIDVLLSGQERAGVSLERLVQRVRRIATALGILPLPEGSVLLEGLADALELGAPSQDLVLRESVARLVVEIDACLDAATRPHIVRDDVLDQAESALAAVRQALPGTRLFDGVLADAKQAKPTAATAPTSSLPPVGLVREDRDQRALTEAALTALDDFGASMATHPVDAPAMVTPLRTLERIGRRAGHPDLSQVCGAALDLLDTTPVNLPIDALEELHAVLPQLIASIGDDPKESRVANLDELIEAFAYKPIGRGDTQTQSDHLAGTHVAEQLPHTSSAELWVVFRKECEVHLDTLEAELAVQPVIASKDLLRALHTIDGSAQTVGAAGIVDAVGPVLAIGAQSDTLTDDQAQQLAEAVASIRRQLVDVTHDDIAIIAEQPMDATSDLSDDTASRSLDLEDVFADEARELIGRLRVDPDRVNASEEQRSKALSVLHTLKGSARVAGWPQLAELAHQHETRIQALALNDLATAMTAARRELDAASPQALESVTDSVQIITTGDTRVTEDNWERLMGLASDLTASQARLSVEIDQLDKTARELDASSRRWRRLPCAADLLESEAARELLADVDSVRASLDAALRRVDSERRLAARVSRAMQQDLVRARLVRFGDTVPRLQEVIADATASLGVQAHLQVQGESVTLDGALCRRLLPAIEQLLRNAVAHGIEPAAERRRAGKDETGLVSVDVSVDGLDLVIAVTDDGRGLPAGANTLEQLEQPGFSTAQQADADAAQLAGHGLGLGSVRRMLHELDGDFRLQNAGAVAGATFELRVPQRVPVQQVLLVEAGGSYGIAVNHVNEVLAYDEDAGATPLAHCLGHTETAMAGDPWGAAADPSAQRILVLSSQGREMRVSVDAVVGYREVVVQALAPQLAALGRFSGCVALAEGHSAMLLNPSAWLEAQATPPAPRVSDTNKTHVLVVDDSPTQRAWLQQQLEGQHWQVTLAHDGQQALELLQRLSVDLIVLDIDMPRIDGYGVLQALREAQWEEPAKPVAPVVMLTSRSSSRDRDAALALGAVEMLAKPVLSDTLLKTLSRLTS